jgi:hypothetical protein
MNRVGRGELFREKNKKEQFKGVWFLMCKWCEAPDFWSDWSGLSFIMTETRRISTALMCSFKTNMCSFSFIGEGRAGNKYPGGLQILKVSENL